MRISDWSSDVCSSDLHGAHSLRCAPFPYLHMDHLRMTRPRFNCILLKLSGEVLMGSSEFGIDPETVDGIAGEIGAAKEAWPEICKAVGCGNMFRGLAAAAMRFDRTCAHYMVMPATVSQERAGQNV